MERTRQLKICFPLLFLHISALVYQKTECQRVNFIFGWYFSLISSHVGNILADKLHKT